MNKPNLKNLEYYDFNELSAYIDLTVPNFRRAFWGYILDTYDITNNYELYIKLWFDDKLKELLEIEYDDRSVNQDTLIKGLTIILEEFPNINGNYFRIYF